MMSRAWPAIVLGVAVAACDATPSAPAPTGSPPGPPAVSEGATSAGPGRNIECVDTEAHALVTFSPAADDLVVGSIKWPGLRGWATADPKELGDSGTGYYKIGAEVRAGATVTVSIPAGHASTAGLEYGQGWEYSPTATVTFHGCPAHDTAYIGGFHLKSRGCVPLDIAENGRPPTRVTVSFFAGPC
jgi:hypothetical protein